MVILNFHFNVSNSQNQLQKLLTIPSPLVETHRAMHGRLKVKTTAEKEAERAKEREKKKAVYLGAMAKIRQLYNSGDRSEKLLLLLGQ